MGRVKLILNKIFLSLFLGFLVLTLIGLAIDWLSYETDLKILWLLMLLLLSKHAINSFIYDKINNTDNFPIYIPFICGSLEHELLSMFTFYWKPKKPYSKGIIQGMRISNIMSMIIVILFVLLVILLKSKEQTISN